MEALPRRQQLCDSQRLVASLFLFFNWCVCVCVCMCMCRCVCVVVCVYYSSRLLGDEKGERGDLEIVGSPREEG